MEFAAIALGLAAVATAAILRWGVAAERKEAPETTPVHASAEDVSTMAEHLRMIGERIGKLEADHLDVRAAVAHGIEDIERVDNRIKATIRRTTRQLEEAGVESPALSAEAQQLHILDGGGGDVLPLPPVHEELADVQSSIPGVSAADLAKVRGAHNAQA